MAHTFPARPARRRVVAGFVAAVVAVPVSLALAGSGQAAPTLTLPQAEAQLAALQTQEDVAVEAYDEGQIVAASTRLAATEAQAAVTAQTAVLATMEKGIASFAVSSYEGTTLDATEMMLAGGDPDTVVARADALGHIATVHATQLAAITSQREVLANATVAATQKSAAATVALTKLAASKNKIVALIAQQQSVVSHLQAQARAALLAQQAAERAAAERAAEAAIAAQQAAARLAAAQQAAAARSTRAVVQTGATTGSVPVVGSGTAAAALRIAETRLGDEYVYGAAGPDTFDCSGLVMWAFAQVGVSLPHSAAEQMGYGTPVAESDLQPGDLVFYNEDGTIGHVGIYVGNGQMLDANHTGGWVGIRDLYSGYAGARRL